MCGAAISRELFISPSFSTPWILAIFPVKFSLRRVHESASTANGVGGGVGGSLRGPRRYFPPAYERCTQDKWKRSQEDGP